MNILVTIIVVISAIGLIATVLLQSGKSAGLSGAITGGAETFFGKKGMDDKFATWSKVFAVAFMVSSQSAETLASLQLGMKVVSGEGADIKPGNALFLKDIPVGTLIHNIELYPGKGAQLVRSAGTSAQLMAKEGKYAQVRLPSGEVRMVQTENSGLTIVHPVDRIKEVVEMEWARVNCQQSVLQR